MSPLLKPINRKQLISQAMKAMSDKQKHVINQADKIIDDVEMFEKNVHQRFISYIKNIKL